MSASSSLFSVSLVFTFLRNSLVSDSNNDVGKSVSFSPDTSLTILYPSAEPSKSDGAVGLLVSFSTSSPNTFLTILCPFAQYSSSVLVLSSFEVVCLFTWFSIVLFCVTCVLFHLFSLFFIRPQLEFVLTPHFEWLFYFFFLISLL